MNVLSISAAVLVVAAPVLAFFAIVRRLLARLALEQPRPKRLGLSLTTFALGALFFFPGFLIERWLRAQTGLDQHAAGTDLVPLVYAFFVAAPLEQGLKVAAVGPVWRSRFFEAPLDGVAYAAAAGLGFVTAHDTVFLLQQGPSTINLGRALLAAPAHLFFAALWGYALGRDAKAAARAGAPQKRLGGRTFNLVWLGVTLFNGVYDHIVFARGPMAMIATTPVLLTMGVLSYVALRELFKSATLLPSAPRRRLFTTLAGSVALGHRLGVDFAAVDQGESTAASTLFPLMLLGGAALLAFPIAGYLVARASATRSVLEPAIAAALAIGGTLILLGLAAPVAVVFAVAFAPVAFGLACAGAWMGIAR